MFWLICCWWSSRWTDDSFMNFHLLHLTWSSLSPIKWNSVPTDLPVLCSSGPAWWSASFTVSKPWAEPLGADAIFLFSYRETEDQETELNSDQTGCHCSFIYHPRSSLSDRIQVELSPQSHLRRDALWGFDADAGIPFTRRKHSDLIQELIDPWQQVIPVLRLVGDIVENLRERDEVCQ